MKKLIRTPEMIQVDALACGVVALGSILAYFGRWVAFEELRTQCRVSRDGTTAADLLRAARGNGLLADAVKATPKHLDGLQTPCILHWNFCHYVIYEGTSARGGIVINDPSRGRRTVSEKEVKEAMTGVVLLFRPGPNFNTLGRKPSLLPELCKRAGLVKGTLAVIMGGAFLLVVPRVVIPQIVKTVTDHPLGQADPNLLGIAVLIVGIITFDWVLSALLQKSTLRCQVAMTAATSRRFVWHLLHLPMAFFDHRFVGDLSSRVNLNERISSFISGDGNEVMMSMAVSVVFVFAMVRYDGILTAIVITMAGLHLALVHYIVRKRTKATGRLMVEWEKQASIALWGIQSIEHVKASGSEDEIFSLWAGQQAKVLTLRQQLDEDNRLVELLPILLPALSTAMIVCIGSILVIAGRLSVGGFVALQIFAAAFSAPINHLGSLNQKLQILGSELTLLGDVMNTPQGVTVAGEKRRATLNGDSVLEVRKLSFSYGGAGLALDGIDLQLGPDMLIAIVGETGCGKSTLAHVLAGLYSHCGGEITINGVAVDEIARHDLAKWIGIVTQGTVMLEGTIRENLAMWEPGTREEELIAATKDACIYEDIMARAGGFDEHLAEDGLNFSGGQLQRLEIARALARRPTFLILDEATSQVDSLTEATIMKNIRRHKCSCIVIAHRLSAIRDADEIIVMDKGRIVERGTHQHLVSMMGTYHTLVARS